MQAAAASSSPSVQQASLVRFLGLELCLGALALASALAASPELRHALVWGVGCSLVASLVSLFAVHRGLASGTSGLLAGFGIGFLARAVLVAAGLFGSGVRGAAALPYVFAFFMLYVATQGVEIAFVMKHSARSPGANAPK